MAVKVTKDGIESDSQIQILDFNIDTNGINLFTANCKVVESKQQTYTISNCSVTDCTTINCTTINCTTVNCTTVNCTTVKFRQDQACSNDN